MREKGVIFDWGGVLDRTVDYSYRIAWDHRLGREPGTVERTVHGIEAWRLLQLGSLAEDDYRAAVREALAISAEETMQLLGDFYQGDQVDTSLLNFVRSLHAHSEVRTGLLSNNAHFLHKRLDETRARDAFDAVVVSADIGAMKPNPAAYQAVLQALDLPAEQCIFIDDSPANVAGARSIGMAAIHFTASVDVQTEVKGWLW
ncbi:MAG: HAD family hydrolase [Anaerolineae bacterium]